MTGVQTCALPISRTDWARRPLSAAALDYAADDVRHLRNLYHKILADLAARDRASWVEPELKALVDEKLYRPDPDNAWHRVRGVQRLKPKTLTLMKSLAAWRERTAMSENRPRQWILKDESMMDLARQLPSDLESLAAVRGVGDSLAKRHGAELLKMLKADGEASAEERHPRETPLKPEQEALVDALNALLRINAAKGDVSAASLANRAELEKLVRGERELPLLKDWRLEMAGRQLLEFLEGRHVLSAAGGALKVTPVK